MSNLSTLPKGDSAWLLRKAIERIIQQVSVLETNIGSSTTGNSANTQVIFNDAGTLRGDAGLTYNAASDILSFGAGICYGDLTVDTSTLKVDSANNRVGIGTASPTVALDVVGASAISGTVSVGTTTPLATGSGRGNVTVNGSTDAILAFGIAGVNSGFVLQDSAGMTLLSSGATYLRCYTNGSERYKIDSTGVATWSNVGGVAGTTMTLNSTGLGVGASPAEKLTVSGNIGVSGAVNYTGSGEFYLQNTASTNFIGINPTSNYIRFGTNNTVKAIIDSSGNLGVGVTPSANKFQVAGNIGLPNSCTASGETSGVFSIDVSNLLALTGGSWRQCSFLLVYSGVDTGLGNSTVLQTVVTLQGLSTYDTISKNDIVGTASVAVSNDTSSGARITVTVPTGNAGSVYVMLLGGAGATTRPSITINA